MRNNVTAGPIAVLGPGGVGGLLAALLAREGERVVCLAGEATVERLRAHGVTVRSNRYGDFTVPVDAESVLSSPVDACVVTVKATALTGALQRVPPSVLGDGLLVPLLNGIEHIATLRRRYPAQAVVAATIRVESTRVAAGEVEHLSPFASVQLAASDGNRERVDDLARRLEKAGLEVKVSDDEAATLWGKLSFLAPLALVTTYADAAAGVVRTKYRDEVLAVVAEVAAVAAAEGAHIDAGAVVASLDGVPESMQSSMQRDAAALRPTELEAIGGAILRAAERSAIPVPTTTRLVTALRARTGAGASS